MSSIDIAVLDFDNLIKELSQRKEQGLMDFCRDKVKEYIGERGVPPADPEETAKILFTKYREILEKQISEAKESKQELINLRDEYFVNR